MLCKYCGKSFVDKYKRKACNSCRVTKSKKSTKLKAIIYKGGKCQRCGYKKSMAALCFHHIDPATKEFGIGENGHTYSWERVKKEIDKCELICQNCHHELHEEKDSKKYLIPMLENIGV